MKRSLFFPRDAGIRRAAPFRSRSPASPRSSATAAHARSMPAPRRARARSPRSSSSTRRRAATRARLPIAGCRSSRPIRRWSPSPSTSTTGTGSAGRIASQRRVHRAPGVAAGEQRRPLQLHAAGRRRRPRSHRLVAGHGVDADSPCGGGRGRRRAPGRPLRRHRHAGGRAPQRLAAYWAVTEQGHVTPSRRARTRA
jgi:hypothetical protein